MRITLTQRALLVDAVRRHFGPGARLWVFGSRTDDGARGGDSDLMLQVEEADGDRLIAAKLALLADLHATDDFEDEKIDVVLFSPRLDPVPRPVQQEALRNGVELAL